MKMWMRHWTARNGFSERYFKWPGGHPGSSRGNTRPGFSSPFGSSACFRRRMVRISSWLRLRPRCSLFSIPIPCSADTDPPIFVNGE